MYKIGYFGREQCDIVFYFIKAANVLNKKIIAVDNSYTGDLFRSLADEGYDIADKGNVVILRNKEVNDMDADELACDLFVYYSGFYPADIDIVFDKVYLDVTQSKIVLDDVKNAISFINLSTQANEVVFILDNFTKKKLSVGACKEEVGIIDIPTVDTELSLDELRTLKYEIFTHAGDCKLKGNSKEFIAFIDEESKTIFNLDAKSFRKLLKNKY